MTFQAITTAQDPTLYEPYDPSDEAEIQRLKERGVSDGAIYDEWSGDEGKQFAAARAEIFGEG
jgi:hypothetical protein